MTIDGVKPMKKPLQTIGALFLSGALLLSGLGTGDAALGNVKYVNIDMDGTKLDLDVRPFIDANSRTIVPIRFIGTNMGYEVTWDNAKKQARVQNGTDELLLTVDSNRARVNDREVILDTTAVIHEGRTMVPLRFVGENMGVEVGYKAETSTVLLRTDRVAQKTLEKVQVDVSSVLNVRSEPRTDRDNVIGKAENGQVFTVKGEQAGWYQIDFGGQSGWISADYALPHTWRTVWVDKEKEPAGGEDIPLKNVRKFEVTVSAGTTLNIRSSPSMSGAILGKAAPGDRFDYLSQSGSWMQIRYGTQTAYAHGDYGKLVTVQEIDWDNVRVERARVSVAILNFRTTPEVLHDNSNRIAQLSFGQEFKILSWDNEKWYEVRLDDGRQGWVSRAYVELLDDEGNPVTDRDPSGERHIRVFLPQGPNINIRSGPSASHEIVGSAKTGDVFQILGENQNWYRVALPDGRTGHMASWLGQTRMEQRYPGQILETDRRQLATLTTLETDGSRVTVGSDRDLLYKVFYINDPARIMIQFYDVTLGSGVSRELKPSGGLLNRVTVQSWGENQVRMMLEFSSPAGLTVDPVNGQRTLAFKGTNAPLAGRTVVVDPGHGAYRANGRFDPGAISPGGLQEHVVNMEVAQNVRNRLTALGANVIMTHGDSGQIIRMDLEDRVALANRSGGDIFVSIHSDSMPSNPAANGMTTYYHNGNGNVSEKQRLAGLVQDELSKATGRPNRGVRTANFHVIRYTQMPSILMEVGFLSNPQEEALLRTSSFRAQAADGIVQGILRYFQ